MFGVVLKSGEASDKSVYRHRKGTRAVCVYETTRVLDCGKYVDGSLFRESCDS